MKPSERKALFNTLDIIAKIDYNIWIIESIPGFTDLSGDEKNKMAINRLRSNIRYKKMLGYDTKNEQKTINEIKKLL